MEQRQVVNAILKLYEENAELKAKQDNRIDKEIYNQGKKLLFKAVFWDAGYYQYPEATGTYEEWFNELDSTVVYDSTWLDSFTFIEVKEAFKDELQTVYNEIKGEKNEK